MRLEARLRGPPVVSSDHAVDLGGDSGRVAAVSLREVPVWARVNLILCCFSGINSLDDDNGKADETIEAPPFHHCAGTSVCSV